MSIHLGRAVRKYKHYIFIVLLVFLTLRVIIPQLSDLGDSIRALSGANLYWILLSIIVFFLSILTSSFQFMQLAFKPIKFGLTVRVQMAVLFVSKLLPSSLGSISLNVYYLMKKNHSASQAAAVMTMDGITSGVAYLILIVAGLLTSDLSLDGLNGSINISGNLIIFIVILLLGIAYAVYRSKSIRRRISQAWKDTKTNFGSYKERPSRLLYATLCNGASSLTSIFVLYASAQALDTHLTFAGALLAYTFGNIAANLIPTPGGIGAVEAGVYAGLVLVGVDGADATLITLIYRLVTYWLPIIPGYLFFLGLRKDLLSQYKLRKNYAA